MNNVKEFLKEYNKLVDRYKLQIGVDCSDAGSELCIFTLINPKNGFGFWVCDLKHDGGFLAEKTNENKN